MNIIWHKNSEQFHLFNEQISYVIGVSQSGEMENLYCGKRIHDRDDMSYVVVRTRMPNIAVDPETESYSMEINRQEYPSFGTTDFGTQAYEIEMSNGSRVSSFQYKSHVIFAGKSKLPGLPATYAEDDEAMTLEITLEDEVAEMNLVLSYTIFDKYPVIARHATFCYNGPVKVRLTRALSCCVDLPDQNYTFLQFSGGWGRERFPQERPVSGGAVVIESKRGTSSANQNPFFILKRPNTDDFAGEALAMSFVYSGNFIAMAEGNSYDRCRLLMGINPDRFTWVLKSGEEFVTPEVIIAMTSKGLNDLSQTLHSLYNNNLIRGKWKNKPRPILNNNWEATYMDFDEEKLLQIASKAKSVGAELFVMDDGWFGERNGDNAGLGDWVENPRKLPQGIFGLSRKLASIGIDFGLWIEPEMVNRDSNLYRRHPDWILSVPGRKPSLGRHQLVLDFSRKDVVDAVYEMIFKVIESAHISYIKWDMNRPLTEVFSRVTRPEEQGMVYHRYVLGVYSLFERLIEAFPDILFESCSSGGNRFDAGMLYYAPQAWCSDNTDAMDRVKIQYGSSYGYPLSSIGSHVSAIPNHQTGRNTSLRTRANVAYFGTFGYELDLNELRSDEINEVKRQIDFMKKHRELLQFGDFYRLRSPFETNFCSWMVVSKDKSQAIVGFYCLNAKVNSIPGFVKLAGLDKDTVYWMEEKEYYGDELMNMGITLAMFYRKGFSVSEDGSSFVTFLEAKR